MFVRDCWYVIAWEHEIPADGLFARRVLGEPIVVFRTENGIAALEDRCCHRAAPLSRGRKSRRLAGTAASAGWPPCRRRVRGAPAGTRFQSLSTIP